MVLQHLRQILRLRQLTAESDLSTATGTANFPVASGHITHRFTNPQAQSLTKRRTAACIETRGERTLYACAPQIRPGRISWRPKTIVVIV